MLSVTEFYFIKNVECHFVRFRRNLFARGFDFSLNDISRFEFTPVIVVSADASVVLQVNSLQVVESSEVTVDLLQFVVINGDDFQDWIVAEEFSINALQRVVACLKSFEVLGFAQKLTRQCAVQVVVFHV